MRARAIGTSEPLNPTAASLLGFLHDGPLSGWDLVTKAEATVGDFWNITKSQVYRELESLHRAGYVGIGKKEGARARRPHTITAAGRAAFGAWLRAEPGPLTMRWPFVLTEFFGRHVDPEMLARFRAVHRAHHAAFMAHLQSLSPNVAQDAHLAAVLDLGIRFHSLVVDWIDDQAKLGKKGTKRKS